ncbi:methyltransferase domain-containing protein [Yersinia sp. 2544 StPb PI]|uniref:methyltransferase domain-containing protein n=1 Tax=Yersinia sp. 2544 StPb PI TaxID=3117409 RepID=UPI003B2816BE
MQGINITLPGLEISPLYRPVTDKKKHNVCYTDYTSAEESRIKHADYEHPEIMELDFIWHPNNSLISCVPDEKKFDWAVASHVFEHIPDPLGWMLEVFDVLNVGATFSLVLPHKDHCFDRYRRVTEVSDIINLWLHQQRIPSPYQLYDFLRNSASEGVTAKKVDENIDRHYTKEQALEFVLNAWTTGTYFDAHCSVFTPKTFYELFREISSLGLISVEIQDPIDNGSEFFIKLIKTGEPSIRHPGSFNDGQQNKKQDLNHELLHAKKAFLEAIDVQNELKKRINDLESDSLGLLKRCLLKFNK